MEIQELKKDIETFFGNSKTGYEKYDTKRLLVLSQQEDKQAKLQILNNFKGLIYNTLCYNNYYLQLNEGDAVQNLCELLLKEIAAWNPEAADAFGNHIKNCLKTAVWSEIRRVKKHDYKEFSYDNGDNAHPSAAEIAMEVADYKKFWGADKKAVQKFTVRELMGVLTRKQRAVIMAGLDNNSSSDIAELLHTKECAIRRIRLRAVERLRKFVLRKGASILC